MSNRKLLLAEIRNGNYAHAGEEEAIELATPYLKKATNQTLLDVGCGLGGTADYFQQHGFGKVIGIDLDQDVIDDAKKLYPNIDFYLCDANHVNHFFKDIKFQIIYSFNAFFCFKNQENCLNTFSEVADSNAELLIFDYTTTSPDFENSPFLDKKGKSTAAANFNPINLNSIESMLKRTNWQFKTILNLDEKFKAWYQELIHRMESNKQHLISKYGEETYNDLYNGFLRLLNLLEKKLIGGAIIHAKKR